MNQIFVGAGAMKIRKVFDAARKNAPCIVFIDEIDAMGRARGSGGPGSGGSDEKESTLNQLLVELDGFDPREGVVLIAATNRPEILDPALTRRGRIDRTVHVGLPGREERSQILRVHLARILACPGLDIDAVAGSTFGFSGADLAALVNEAALSATRRAAPQVEIDDFRVARDRMMLGLKGSAIRLSDEERALTAWHEAAHALLAYDMPEADPIEKATILPRGRALGFVMQMPDRDRPFESRQRLETRMMILAAGRVAEELAFGSGRITTGAASDIQALTRIAHAMVTEWGMSGAGFVCLDPTVPGMSDPNDPPIRHVRELIDTIVERTRAHLEANRRELDALARALIARETLEGDEVGLVIEGVRAKTISTAVA